MLLVCNLVFAEIEDYCPRNLSTLVEFSNIFVGYSTYIGETVKISCITGYLTYQNAVLIAICEEYSFNKGQWRISGSCQRTHMNFLLLFLLNIAQTALGQWMS